MSRVPVALSELERTRMMVQIWLMTRQTRQADRRRITTASQSAKTVRSDALSVHVGFYR